ncbi:MAG: NUDIX domain-containing protein [Candidatus Sumerlaeaceae bacterium]|nr:NUDIX domain-containing protein [Candidatus Sumerlaeaceae bacterium]
MSKVHEKIQVHLYHDDAVTGTRSFLVLRRPPNRGGFWQPVTGNLTPGESAESGAMREIWEETGLEAVHNLEPVGEFTFENRGKQFHEKIFVGAVDSRKIKLCPEHDEFRWSPYVNAREMIHFESNRNGLDQAASLLARKDM